MFKNILQIGKTIQVIFSDLEQIKRAIDDLQDRQVKTFEYLEYLALNNEFIKLNYRRFKKTKEEYEVFCGHELRADMLIERAFEVFEAHVTEIKNLRREGKPGIKVLWKDEKSLIDDGGSK